jgi:hypothetical protein
VEVPVVRVKLEILDIYSFLDPAGKKQGTDKLKKVRANTALVTIGVDPLQRVIVLEAWRAKTSAAATTRQVFDTNDRWHPKMFGCEANAMQELYADMLLLEAQRQNIRINLVPITQPTNVDKHWRIRTVLNPLFNHGRLFLLSNQHDLHRELTSFPMSPLVDLVDALASACAMIPPKPKPPAESADEAAEVAKYLRDRGVAPHIIHQRVAAIRGEGAGSPVDLFRPLR